MRVNMDIEGCGKIPRVSIGITFRGKLLEGIQNVTLQAIGSPEGLCNPLSVAVPEPIEVSEFLS